MRKQLSTYIHAYNHTHIHTLTYIHKMMEVGCNFGTCQCKFCIKANKKTISSKILELKFTIILYDC